jgi:putative NADPH-quinone reductase
MRLLVVYCHPVETSYVGSLHSVVLEALSSDTHDVTDLDLYAEGFDPVLTREERLEYYNPGRNTDNIQKYADQLLLAEGILLIYPSWWYGLPAMLKGYFDRVWLPGVAFDVKADGRIGTDRLRHIRRIVVVTTYGSPWWLIRLFMGDPARKFISRGLRRICGRGCRITWYVKYGMDRATPDQLNRFLTKVRSGVSKL